MYLWMLSKVHGTSSSCPLGFGTNPGSKSFSFTVLVLSVVVSEAIHSYGECCSPGRKVCHVVNVADDKEEVSVSTPCNNGLVLFFREAVGYWFIKQGVTDGDTCGPHGCCDMKKWC